MCGLMGPCQYTTLAASIRLQNMEPEGEEQKKGINGTVDLNRESYLESTVAKVGNLLPAGPPTAGSSPSTLQPGIPPYPSTDVGRLHQVAAGEPFALPTQVTFTHHNPLPFRKHPLPLPRGEAIWLRGFGTASDWMDGDTAHFIVEERPRHGMQAMVVRMDGYDAPEHFGKNKVPEGAVARDALAALVVDKPVMILLQDGIMTVNRFPGRVYAWREGEGINSVWVDVSRRMYFAGHIKSEWAQPNPPPSLHWPFPGTVTEMGPPL